MYDFFVDFPAYKEYFAITYDSNTNQADIAVSKEPTLEILKTGKPLIIELTALDSNKNEAKAVLEITLPSVEGPEFQKTYYDVTYPTDGKGPLDVAFTFQDGIDPTKVTVALEGKT